MRETLQKIVESTPGAVGAILMGFDGIAVDQVLIEGSDTDIESLAMEFSFRFIELREAAESLELGGLQDVTVKAEAGSFLARVISDEFFVGLLLADTGFVGKGRWMLRSTETALQAEL
jgi:predicted regulator of Ras-like GTPase activity (Roadblock/LC7/MglB family)